MVHEGAIIFAGPIRHAPELSETLVLMHENDFTKLQEHMSQNLVCKKCNRTCFTFTEYGCSDSDCPYGNSLGPLRSNEDVRRSRAAVMKNSPMFKVLVPAKWDQIFDNKSLLLPVTIRHQRIDSAEVLSNNPPSK